MRCTVMFTALSDLNWHMFAQHIYHVYLLEIPTIIVLEQILANNVYPSKPQYYKIKVGFKGV